MAARKLDKIQFMDFLKAGRLYRVMKVESDYCVELARVKRNKYEFLISYKTFNFRLPPLEDYKIQVEEGDYIFKPFVKGLKLVKVIEERDTRYKF